MVVVAAVPVVIGGGRASGEVARLGKIVLLVFRRGMGVNVEMRGAAVVVDMHMGLPAVVARHRDTAQQPDDREERSERNHSNHDGAHPH